MAELLDVGLESPGRVERVVLVVGVFADACKVERGWYRVGRDTRTFEGLSKEQQQKQVEGERDEDRSRESAEIPGLARVGDGVVVARQETMFGPVVNRVRTSEAKWSKERAWARDRGSERRKEQAKQVVSFACPLSTCVS